MLAKATALRQYEGMNTSQEKTAALREVLKAQGLDGFIVPKADEYQGEFVAPYAERLKWLTDFSGSAGVAVVLQDIACVLTDGRYALQVSQQVDRAIYETGDSVEMGVAGWLEQKGLTDITLGFDPWLHTPDQIEKIQTALPDLILTAVKKNPLDAIWDDQPIKPCGPIMTFSDKIAGQNFVEKKALVGQIIKDVGATAAIITLPDSIAWLLNIRGHDMDYIPGVHAFVIIHADPGQPVQCFTNPKKVIQDLQEAMGPHFEILDPEALPGMLASLKGPVLLDHARSACAFKNILDKNNIQVLNKKDPCIDLKAQKTDSEYEALCKAHKIDGLALTKFLYWLSQEAPIGRLTEMQAADKLEEFRSAHPAYKGPSFPTIAGFGPNGAIIHYRADEKSDTVIETGNMLLLDSGGQYYDGFEIAGTTDITRTIAIGEVSEEMRENFTRVLKGHIALASARFPDTAIGKDIDALARKPLQDVGLDYAHGTGHGVGCYLAVHEEATSISSRGKDLFRPGMLISNEPGYYKGGAYGIRIENLVFTKQGQGQTLEFETVSFAPIDRSLIKADLLDDHERAWLNAYHAKVFELLSASLSGVEREWLKEQLAPIEA